MLLSQQRIDAYVRRKEAEEAAVKAADLEDQRPIDAHGSYPGYTMPFDTFSEIEHFDRQLGYDDEMMKTFVSLHFLCF